MSLTSDNLAVFEGAVTALVSAVEAAPETAQGLFTKALSELEDGALADSEVSRRARRIAESLPGTDTPALRALAASARDAGAAARSGVLAVLSPGLMSELYRSAEQREPVAPESSGAVSAAAESELAVEAGPEDSGEEVQGEWGTVLLLGDSEEIQVNERLLEQRDLRTIKVADEAALTALASESFSALVIHAGFWASLPNDRSKIDVLRAQFSRATIAYFRIDSDGLGDDAASLLELLRQRGPDLQSRVVLAAGSQLAETDFIAIRGIAELLESAKASRITVEGLSERESRLLSAAIALFASRPGPMALPPRARDLRVSALASGGSSARVLRVVAPVAGPAYVAKLDDVERLSLELQTARVVAPSTESLEMEIYSLGGAAVLIQRLVADNDEPTRSAPSFRERVEARNAWERGRDMAEPLADELVKGITRLTRTLSALSARPADGMDGQCWTTCEPLANLRTNGLLWRIVSSDGVFDPLDLVDAARSFLEPQLKVALVHGDLHAGNVLMADDRSPRLIDFANAGAGHPMFDFVRFGSAVAYTALAPVVPEEEMRPLFEAALIEGCHAEALIERFPEILASGATKLGGHALCSARAGAIEAAATHHLEQTELHFLALMYLVAAQSLTRSEFQSAVVRAALGAMYPSLREQLA